MYTVWKVLNQQGKLLRYVYSLLLGTWSVHVPVLDSVGTGAGERPEELGGGRSEARRHRERGS